MAIAYLVGTPFSNPNSWASSSGGGGGTFGGTPIDSTDIIIDANSPNATSDLSAKSNSITISKPAVVITQSVALNTDAFMLVDGTWDTAGFDFTCLGVFTKSGGNFIGALSNVFLVGALLLSGSGTFSGVPALPPTILNSEDVQPTTIAEAILDLATSPQRVKGDMGEVEMPLIRDVIQADKYEQSKKAVKAGIGSMLKQIKPTGTV